MEKTDIWKDYLKEFPANKEQKEKTNIWKEFLAKFPATKDGNVITLKGNGSDYHVLFEIVYSDTKYSFRSKAYGLPKEPILTPGIHIPEKQDAQDIDYGKYQDLIHELEDLEGTAEDKESIDEKFRMNNGLGFQTVTDHDSITLSSVHELTGHNDIGRLVRRMERYLFFMTMTFHQYGETSLDNITWK